MPRLWSFLSLIVLAATVFAIYSQTFRYGIVDYDDTKIITGDPLVTNGLAVAKIPTLFTTAQGNLWNPVSTLTIAADWELWGNDFGAHHRTAVLLFLIITWLLYALAVALGLPPGAALFAALIFAAHPLRVESVAWLSSRKDLCCGVFSLLALLFYVRAARGSERLKPSSLIASVVCFALAVASKPAAVVIPGFLVCLDLWPLKRGAIAGLLGNKSRSLVHGITTYLKRELWEKWMFVAVAGAGAAAAVLFQAAGTQAFFAATNPLSHRLFWAPVAVGTYIWRSIVPMNLAFEYPYPPGKAEVWILASGILGLGLSVAAWRCRLRLPTLIFGWAWFLIGLFPVLGIFYVGASFTSDRYTFLPHLGVALAIGAGLARLWQLRGNGVKTALAVGAILLIATSAVFSFHQVKNWENSRALFAHATTAQPRLGSGPLNLGVLELREGQKESAIGHLREAIARNPLDHITWFNLGNALASTPAGRNEASAALDKALSIYPGYLPALISATHLSLDIYATNSDPDALAKSRATASHAMEVSGGNHPPVLWAAARAAATAGEIGEAKALCQKLLQKPEAELPPAMREKVTTFLQSLNRRSE